MTPNQRISLWEMSPEEVEDVQRKERAALQRRILSEMYADRRTPHERMSSPDYDPLDDFDPLNPDLGDPANDPLDDFDPLNPDLGDPANDPT